MTTLPTYPPPTYPPLTSLPRHITLDETGGPSIRRDPSTNKDAPLSQPSPILAPAVPLEHFPTMHSQYAEDFTPLKLRRKKRHAPPAAGPLVPGSSAEGYYTAEGDLYRGAVRDPALAQTIEEDAVTLGGSSSTSSSSSWSWASGISAGRRAKAVIDRVGEALRVRRGSDSSSGSEDGGRRRSLTMSRSLTLNRSLTMSRSLTLNRSKSRTRRLSRTATVESEPRRPPQIKRREFTLLLPPPQGQDVVSRVPTPQGSISETTTPPPDRVITTPSLHVVLDHLRTIRGANGLSTPPETPLLRGGSASGRPHRPKYRHAASFVNPVPRNPRQRSRLQVLREQSMPDVPRRPKSVSDIIGMSGLGASSTSLSGMATPEAELVVEKPKGCWWLDVSCPTWEDLRDLGEVLGLHPLTLEDVLDNDPREKLDTFDSLGYYLVVFRALDEQYFKYTPGSSPSLVGPGRVAEVELEEKSDGEIRAQAEKHHQVAKEIEKEGRRRGWGMGRAVGKGVKSGERVEIVENQPGKEGLEGLGVGAHNVYLCVFADGIISFHFEDVSKHTKRVLNRILSNASARVAPGSDWIAHGLLDSIVDAWLPLARFVDSEVDTIDTLTIDPTAESKPPDPPQAQARSSETLNGVLDEKASINSEKLVSEPPRHQFLSFVDHALARLPSFYIHVPLPLLYLKLFFLPVTNAVPIKTPHLEEHSFDRGSMLQRITGMRKLVTGLTRTLGSKHQVVAKLRKRAKETGASVDAAYIGDVEDHILLLESSLNHYDYILSTSQTAYLSQLSVSSVWARGATDQAILALSTVTIGVLPMQVVIGLFSLNISIPHNGLLSTVRSRLHLLQIAGTPFTWYFGILGFLVLVSCVVVSVVRLWRWQARMKWAKIRGKELPDPWDAYWGWI